MSKTTLKGLLEVLPEGYRVDTIRDDNTRSITIYAGDTTVEEDYPGLLETEVLGVEPIESDERLDAYLAD